MPRPGQLLKGSHSVFFGVYFFIYIFYSFGIISELTFLLDPVVALAGKILKVKYQYIEATGSGDTTYDYLLLFCFFWVSVFACLTWSVLDRKRKSYNKLLYWYLVMLRYSLGMIMIGYGSAKIFYSQFSSPTPSDLVQPFGEFSPMGLAWRFMGYSYAFNLYTGIAEALGGFLLFFRRTTNFGALFSMTVLSTVVAMNFCYDIPVKLFSSHLLLMAVIIAAPEIKRLTTFFFTDNPVPASATPVVHLPRKLNYIRVGLKFLVLGAFLFFVAKEGYSGMYEYGEFAPKSAFNGVYDVRYFIRNHDTIQPVMTDTTRWQQLVIEDGYASVSLGNKKQTGAEIEIDTVKKNLTWKPYRKGELSESERLNVSYAQPLQNELILAWRSGVDTVNVVLTKKGPNDYLLISRGFHWVNEYPFNR